MIKNNNINPWTLTGLIDAEGCLGVNISSDIRRKSGYAITLYVEIGLNVKDKALLECIRSTTKVGNIYYKPRDKTYRWKVSNLNELSNVIIPHLTNHPLITQKRADFELFTKIVDIIKRKHHFNSYGLQEIVNLKASLNIGATLKLKTFFPNTVAVFRPNIHYSKIPDPNWLSGFADGEACFFVSVYKSPKSKLGLAVQLVFKITQHSRDMELLIGIKDFFECGRVEKRNKDACDFTVNRLKDFELKIIPFFLKYPLKGSKVLNFKDLNKVVNIMKIKGHLTKKGLKTILDIKYNMNTGRNA